MVSPLGTKGDQAGIWQSLMCLRVLAMSSVAAPLPKVQGAQRIQPWFRHYAEKRIIAYIEIFDA